EPTRSARDAVPRTFTGPILDLGGDRAPDLIWRRIVEHAAGSATVVGIGNIHGQGERLLEYLHTSVRRTRADVPTQRREPAGAPRPERVQVSR
ncbi:MAG TPA: hypothetical protein VF163_07585, partial [Micromonosporaceae bacterium]